MTSTASRLIIVGALVARGVDTDTAIGHADAIADALDANGQARMEQALGWDHADDERYVAPT